MTDAASTPNLEFFTFFPRPVRREASPPVIVRALVVLLQRKANSLSFDYEAGRTYDLSVNSLADVLKQVAIARDAQIPPLPAYSPTTGPGTRRRGRRKLSLNVGQASYVILKLSDKDDWQFPSNDPPFALGRDALDANFFNAKKVSADGLNIDAQGDGCRVAYMGVLGSQNPRQEFININIELLDRGNDGIDQKIPIVIDPDIGWPEGTNPDGP